MKKTVIIKALTEAIDILRSHPTETGQTPECVTPLQEMLDEVVKDGPNTLDEFLLQLADVVADVRETEATLAQYEEGKPSRELLNYVIEFFESVPAKIKEIADKYNKPGLGLDTSVEDTPSEITTPIEE